MTSVTPCGVSPAHEHRAPASLNRVTSPRSAMMTARPALGRCRAVVAHGERDAGYGAASPPRGRWWSPGFLTACPPPARSAPRCSRISRFISPVPGGAASPALCCSHTSAAISGVAATHTITSACAGALPGCAYTARSAKPPTRHGTPARPGTGSRTITGPRGEPLAGGRTDRTALCANTASAASSGVSMSPANGSASEGSARSWTWIVRPRRPPVRHGSCTG